MSYFTGKQRLKIALGGLVSFIGFITLALTILAVTRTIDARSIFQPSLLVDVMVVLGILDVLTGIVLLRSR
jgi:predicted transporter